MTYKLYVMTSEGGRWVTNGLKFDTVEETLAAGRDLFGRWMLVTDFIVVESDGEDAPTDEAGLAARGILGRR
jgi:hypothetical protein